MVGIISGLLKREDAAGAASRMVLGVLIVAILSLAACVALFGTAK